MGKETWSIDLKSVVQNFANFSQWYRVEEKKFVGVLFGAPGKISTCLFLSDDHLKRSQFEFVSNALPADQTFVGILVVDEHEPDIDIGYMGPGLELSTTLSALENGDIESILTANPHLTELEIQLQGVTVVSKTDFTTVLRKGSEDSDLKYAVEKFAAGTGELAFFHKNSGIVLQPLGDIPKVLDEFSKGSSPSKDHLIFTSFRRISACEEGSGDEQKHVPVLKVQRDNVKVSKVSLSLEITCPAYFGESSKTIYGRLEEAARRRAYNLLYVLLKGMKKHGVVAIDSRTFLHSGWKHHIALNLPKWPEAEKKSFRIDLHKLFNLSSHLPCLRDAQAIQFANSSHLLRNPHLSITNYKPTGQVSTVRGSYNYHHYMQDNFDDAGWGCAYRSMQTIWSWFVLNGFTDKPIPTHKEIQQCLVDIGDKPPKFVGSRQWIGSTEIGFVLETLLGIESKYLVTNSGAEVGERVRELAVHFMITGTPVMIGGAMLAHTILGVDFDESSGDCKFLVLDPHYTGGEDIKTVTSKGWCAWKPASFWKAEHFYNCVLPQPPKDCI